MPRRLSTFFPLMLGVTVGLFALTSALTAQPSAQPAAPSGEGIKRSQEENLKLYKRFADELLKLAQKWEKSDNLDEKARAKTLRSALQLAEKHGVEALFKGVVNTLGNAKNPTGGDFDAILAKDRALVKALEEILETLNTEDETARLRQDISDLKEFIKEVTRIKREQENLRARTDGSKSDPGRLAKDQGSLAKETKELADKLNKGDPKDPKKSNNDGNNPEPKDNKSEPKEPAKPGDPAAEPKSDPKDPKSTDKDPSGMGDPKAGGEPKGGTKPDAGSSKEAPKDGAGQPKPMSGEPKPMNPGESKPQGDGKGNTKPADGKGGDSKPMNPSGGMPPSDSPPGGSKGSPSGSPSGSPPPSGPRPPNPNNPNDEAQRKVEEAVPDQKQAEQKLKENKRNDASKKEDDAIAKLDQALKDLEKRLKQLREKEMLKKLEDLERRVAKMLQMQVDVKAATERIDLGVKKNANTMTTADKQKAGVEAEKEGQIVEEAEKALRLLEGEGTAVVFAGVLGEVQKDMKAVQDQLNRANIGADTQLVEDQIIAQLKRMLEALKKAKQDLENPPPPPPPGMPPPGDQKKNLIQLVEQLKLLKDLQIQVNERTTAFGKRSPGEQAADPFIQEQLKQLGDRQKILQDMLHKVAAQLNQQ